MSTLTSAPRNGWKKCEAGEREKWRLANANLGLLSNRGIEAFDREALAQ